MIRITIVAATVREIPYTDKKGRAAVLRAQAGYAHTIDKDGVVAPFPEKFEILLPRDQAQPFAAGDYQLHPSALAVSDGRLSCTPRLVALPKAPAKTV